MLEVADEEFMRLKNDLLTYSATIETKVKAGAPGVSLDKITLKIFIETSEALATVEENHRWQGQTAHLPIPPEVLDEYVEYFKCLGVEHIDSLAHALERHEGHIAHGATRCAQVDYGPSCCPSPVHKGWSLWMLIQLLCAGKPTLAETVELFKSINLWIPIPDSLDAYAESLRTIVRQTVPASDKIAVQDYKSVYVTLVDQPGTGNSFPLELIGDRWVWENVAVTDQQVIIEGHKYPIESKTPLFANILHKGKRFVITQ